VQKVEQAALRHVLKYNDYVGYFGHDPHKEGDIWMTQDCLHNYFILYFCEQIISD
jgi:hypothetical protein